MLIQKRLYRQILLWIKRQESGVTVIITWLDDLGSTSLHILTSSPWCSPRLINGRVISPKVSYFLVESWLQILNLRWVSSNLAGLTSLNMNCWLMQALWEHLITLDICLWVLSGRKQTLVKILSCCWAEPLVGRFSALITISLRVDSCGWYWRESLISPSGASSVLIITSCLLPVSFVECEVPDVTELPLSWINWNNFIKCGAITLYTF